MRAGAGGQWRYSSQPRKDAPGKCKAVSALMALAQHIGVLHHGEVIARGTPAEIVRNPAVLECCLAEEAEV